MTAVIPWVFASLAALMLGVGIVGFWQSVRAALGLVDESSARSEGATDAEAVLFARKRAILEGIRELDFDHESGKLSDADHERERERLRAEAKEAFRAIDVAIGPHRAAAEARVAARLGSAPPVAPAPKAVVAAPAEVKERSPFAAAPTKHVCAACSVENDSDAVFCKRCGAKVEASAVEAAP